MGKVGGGEEDSEEDESERGEKLKTKGRQKTQVTQKRARRKPNIRRSTYKDLFHSVTFLMCTPSVQTVFPGW